MLAYEHDCWLVSGPTASGKSAVAMLLAPRLNAEIVSVDSMAVYRGMDIGTAKPTADQQSAVGHHLLDLVDPDHEFSVAQFLAAARGAVEAIRSRGRRVLFVGGTPLYLKALLDGLAEGPAADWELRARLVEAVQRHGPEALHTELASVDPAAAARLHPRDARRVIRALEVFRRTGLPISTWQAQQRTLAAEQRPTEALSPHPRAFVLIRARDDLERRIDRRVEAMFAGGLLDEVARLQASHLELSRTARWAVGYQEALDLLEGRIDRAAAIARAKTRSRRLAKRQGTWFRSLSPLRPVPVAPDDPPELIARRILELAPPAERPPGGEASNAAAPR